MRPLLLRCGFIIVVLVAAPLSGRGAEFHVAPTGTSTGDGSPATPLDLPTALNGKLSPAKPGDTIWLRGGVYPGPFTSTLAGADGNRIAVRAVPGERPILRISNLGSGYALRVDGGWTDYVGFEVENDNPTREPWTRFSGVGMFGPGTRLINCVVHGCATGIGCWTQATDAQVYGCISFDNGYYDTNWHGHGIYTQNKDGTKRLADNIIFHNYEYGIHAYGTSGAYLRNFLFEGNISFENGINYETSRKPGIFIGGNAVADQVRVIGNYLYSPFDKRAASLELGMGTTTTINGRVEYRGNYVIGGKQFCLAVSRWQSILATGNTTYGAHSGYNDASVIGLRMPEDATVYANYTIDGNTYLGGDPNPFHLTVAGTTTRYSLAGWRTETGWDATSTHAAGRPTGVWGFVRPNAFEPGRANIAIYNWDKSASVTVDVSAVGIPAGAWYEVRNAQDYFGVPVASGVYAGGNITIPMSGPAPQPEFGAFVLTSVMPDDKTAPTVKSGTATDAGAVTVTFSENVRSTDATTKANYTVESPTGTAVDLTPATIKLTYDAATFTARISGITLKTGDTYKITVKNVPDIAGNAIVNNGTTNVAAGTVTDATAPTISTSSAGTSGKVSVEFSEDVDSADATNKANYALQSPTGTAIDLSPGGITLAYDIPTATATLSGLSLTLGNSYTVVARNIRDPAGNPMVGDQTSTGTVVDDVPPTFASATANDTGAVRVVFSEDVDSADATNKTNFALQSPTGTAKDLAPAGVTLAYDAATRTTTISGLTLVAGNTYKVTVNGVKDTAGNAMASANRSGTVADATDPTVASASATNAGVVSVRFSENVNSTDAVTKANFTLESPTGTAKDLTPAGVTLSYAAGTFTTTISGLSLTGGNTYSIRVRSVRDANGRTIQDNGTTNVATGTVSDVVAPGLASCTANDAGTVRVVFTEAVQSADATNKARFALESPTGTAKDLTPAGVTLAYDAAARATTISGLTLVAGNTYKLTVTGVRDTAGNAMAATSLSGSVADVTAPTVTSSSATDAGVVTVGFSENVNSTHATTKANFTLESPTGTGKDLTPAGVTLAYDAATFTTTVSGVSLQGGASYRVRVRNVQDAAAHPIVDNGSTNVSTGSVSDVTAPGLASSTANDAGTARVVFTEAVQAADATNKARFALESPTGTAVDLTPAGITLAYDAGTRATTIAGLSLMAGNTYRVTVTGVRDAAGNAMGATSRSGSVADVTLPTVIASSATDAGAVTVRFSENVNSTDAATKANFTLESPTGTAVDLAPAGVGISYDAGTRSTTLTGLALTASSSYTVVVRSVRDVAGNAIVDNGTTNTAAGVVDDVTPPAVVSSLADDTGLVKVTFSGAVQAADATAKADFGLESPTGTAIDLSPAGVTLAYDAATFTTTLQGLALVAGSTYTVTVSNVRDAAGNAIPAGGVTSTGTVSDATAPSLASCTATDAGTVRVIFTEAVQAADATDKARFALESPTGTAIDLAPAGITLLYDAATRATTLSGLSLGTGATYTLTVTGVRDAAGNAMPAASLSGSVADVTGPTVLASSASDAGVLTVRFSESVNSTDAVTKANLLLESPTGTAIDLTPGGVGVSYDAATRTSTVTGLTLTAGSSYTVRVLGVRDVAGNAIVDNGATNVGAGVVGDVTTPAVVSSLADDTGLVRVTFSENVQAGDATAKASFLVESPTGTAVDLNAAGVSLEYDAATFTTIIHGLTLAAGSTYTITVRDVRDAAGNAIPAGGLASTGTVDDATSPGLASCTANDAGTVRVVFTEAVQAADATSKARFALESPTGTAIDLAPAGITLAYDAGTRATTLSGLSLTAGTTYRLTVTGVRDAAGNAMAATSLSGSVADVTPPTVVASSATNAGTVTARFSEGVNSTDAATKANFALESPTGTAVDLAPAGVGISYSAATRTVTLTGLTLTAGNSYTVRVRSVRDAAGNAIVDNGTTNVSAGTVGDVTAPALASSSADDTGAVGVTFTEAVSGGDATAKANFGVESPTGTALDLNAAGVTLGYDAATFTTTIEGLALVAGSSYRVTARSVRDATGNAMDAGGITSSGVVADATPPALVSSTANDAGTVRVVFTESVQAADAINKARFALESPTGTAIDLAPAGVTLAYDAGTRATTISGLSLAAGSTYRLTVTGVRDAAGNAMAATSLSGNVADVTPPTVVASSATDAGAVTVRFSESVNSADAVAKANFALESPTGTAIDLTPGGVGIAYDAATRSATLTGLSLTAGGSYTIRVRSVRDAAGNAIVDNGTTNVATGVVDDVTTPGIASSSADDTGAVRVTFAEAVNAGDAVAKANFGLESPTGTPLDLNAAGVALAYDAATFTTTIQGLTLVAGSTYTVTARNVRDTAGNAMPAGGDSSTGTVDDASGPGLASCTANDAGVVRVVFTEAVQAADATNKARFALESPTGTAKDLTPAGVTLAYDAGTRATTLSGLSLTAGSTYKLTVTGVRDAAGNAMAATSLSGSVADVTAPILAASTATNGGTVTARFSENVNGTDAADKANFTLESPTGTAVDLTPAGIGISYSAATRTVTLTGLTLTAGISYTVRVRSVRDVAGNAIVDNGTTNVSAGSVGDVTAPALASSSADDTGVVRVAFTEAVNSGDATAKGNFGLESPTGTAIDLSPAGVTLAYDAATFATTLQGLTLVAGNTYRVTVRSVRDAAGNAMDAGGLASSGSVTDATPPSLVSSTANDGGAVRVVFSEAVQAADAINKARFALESPTGTAIDLAPGGVTLAYDAGTRATTISALSLVAGSTYKLTVTGVKDTAGNAMAAASLSGSVADVTPAIVTASSATTAGRLTVTFSEAVNAADAAAKGNYTLQSPTGTAIDLAPAGIGISYDAATRTVTLTGLTFTAGSSYKVWVRTVRDVAGNAVVDNGTTNVSAGVVDDVTAPALVSSQAEDAGFVKVTFSENVVSADATAKANFGLESPTGTAIDLSPAGVTLAYDAATFTTTIQGLTLVAGSTYKATVRSVRDAAGNAMDAGGVASSGVVGDATAPSLVSASANDAGTARVVFSEAVQAADATDKARFALESPTGTGIDLAPAGVTLAYDAGTRATTISGVSLTAGDSYKLTVTGVRDAAANAMAAASLSGVVADVTPATVIASSATTAGVLTVSFSEPLHNGDGAAKANYTLQSPIGTAIDLTPAGIGLSYNGATRTATFTGLSLTAGNSYTIRVRNVLDAAGNTIVDNGTTNVATGVVDDATPPAVVSSQAEDAGFVKVTFSENVVSADATAKANFGLESPTGTVIDLSPAGVTLAYDAATFTTTIQGLTLVAGNTYKATARSISDAAGNAMDAGGVTSSGTVADATPPSLVSSTANDGGAVRVVFSEAVQAADAINKARFALESPTGTAIDLTPGGVTLAYDAGTRATTISALSLVAGSTYKLTVTGVRDAAGNAMPAASLSGSVADVTPATVSASSATTAGRLSVTFSEAVNSTDAADKGNYALESPTGTAIDLSPAGLGLSYDAAARTASFTGLTLTAGRSYTIRVRNVRDAAGNAIVDNGTTNVSAGVVDDATAPSIVSSQAEDAGFVKVTFSENVVSADATAKANFGLESPTGTAIDLSPAGVTLAYDAATFTTTIQGLTLVAGNTYKATARSIRDAAGNAMDAGGVASSGLVGDATAPSLVSASANDAGTARVVFSEAVQAADAANKANFALESPTGTAIDLAPAGVTLAYDAGTRATTISGVSLAAGDTYKLTVTGVRDAAANAMAAASLSGVVADVTAATVIASSATTAGVLTVSFSEPLHNGDGAAKANYTLQSPIGTAIDLTPAGIGLSYDGATRTARFTGLSLTAGNSYTTRVRNVLDAAGNTIVDNGTTNVATGVVDDATPPAVVSTQAEDAGFVKVAFSESVVSADATAKANFGLESPTGTAIDLSPAGVTLAYDAATFTTTIQGLTLVAGNTYRVTVRGVRDGAGNAIPAGGVTSSGVVGDATPPSLVSSSANDAGTARVVFSEAVQAADATDKTRFALESPTGTAIDLAAAGITVGHVAASRTTTISGLGLIPGNTYKLTVTGVKDTAGNAMAATSLSGSVADVTAPTLAASSATNAGAVTARFSEAVNSTDAANKANFALESPTGTAIDLAPAGVGISYSGATRTTALTGLALTAGNSYSLRVRNVRDVAGNAIADDGTTNVSIGAVGDAAAPGVASSAADDTGAARVTFTEAVNSGDATAKANFGLESPTGTAVDLSPAGVTLAYDAATFTTTIQGLTLVAGNTYRVTVRSVRDAAGNAMDAGGVTSSGTVADATPPALVSSTANDAGAVRVVFTEAVQAADATNKARFVLESPTGTAINLTPAGIALAYDAGTRATTLSGLGLTAGNTFKLTVTGVRDAAGNAMAATSLSGSVADVTPPTLAASSATNAGALTARFSESVNSTDAADKPNFALESPTGTAVDLAPAGVGISYTAATRTVTLTGLTLTAGNSYSLRVRTVRDVAGNAIVDNGTTNVAAGTVGDATAPTVASSSADDTGAARVTFTEAVNSTDATAKANFGLESPTGTVIDLSPAGVTLAYDAATFTTTIQGLTLVAGNTYRATVRSVRDAVGNAIPAGGVTSSGVVSDATAPGLVSSSANDAGTARVVFTEAVQAADATDKTRFTLESPTGTAIDLTPGGVTLAYDAGTRATTISALSLIAGNTYKLTVTGVRDAAGNAMPAASLSGSVADVTPATVSASSATTAGRLTATFSEAVNSTDAAAKGNYTLESPTGTAIDLAPAGVGISYSAATRTVTLTGLTLTAGNSYTVRVRSVRDVAGNSIVDNGTTNVSAGTIGDATAPAIASSSADDIGAARVTFTEAVNAGDAVAKANFSLESPTGTAIDLSPAGVTLAYEAATFTTTIQGLTLVAGNTYKATVRSVRDAAGNAMDAGGVASSGVVGDATAPSLVSSAADDAGTARVVFTEAVQAADASNKARFALESPTGTAIDLAPAGITLAYAAATRTTTISGLSLTAGSTYKLTVTGVRDAAGNAMAAASLSGSVADVTAPTVAASSATNAGTVTARFSESVNNTDAADKGNFALESPTGTAIDLAPAGVGLSYDAATRTATLTGLTVTAGNTYTIRVRNVRDVAGNAIVDNGTTNVSAGTVGDATAPAIASAAADDTGAVRVTFSEAVNSGDATAKANFGLESPTGTAIDLDPAGVTLAYDAATRTTTISGLALVAGRTYTATVRNVRDAAGNAMPAGGVTSSGTVSDATPPALVSSTADDAGAVRVVFTEAVQAADATNKARFALESPTGTAIDLAPAGITLAYVAAARTTTISGLSLTAGNTYKLTVTGVRDTAGNAMAATSLSGSVADVTAPTVTASTATTAGRLTVTFSEAVNSTDAAAKANYTLESPTGTAIDLAPAGIGLSYSAAARTATVTGLSLTSGNTYTIRVRNVRDVAGNAIVDNGTTNVSAGTVGDATAPAIASSAADDTGAVRVTFTEAVNGGDAVAKANFGLESPTGTAIDLTPAGVTLAHNAATRTTTISGLALVAGRTYRVTVRNVKDAAGNAISAGGVTSSGTVSDATAPGLVSATGDDSGRARVVFTEAVQAADATNKARFALESPTGTAKDLTPAGVTLAHDAGTRTTTISGLSLTAGSTYKLTVTGVRDTSGNAMAATSLSGSVADVTAPTVTASTASTAGRLTVAFSEAVNSTDAAAKANYTLESPTGTAIDLAPAAIGLSYDAATRTATLTGLTVTAGNTYTIRARNVRDVAGNAIVDNGTTNVSAGTVGDATAPAIASSSADDTGAVRVTFTEGVVAGDATAKANFGLESPTGTAIDLTPAGVTLAYDAATRTTTMRGLPLVAGRTYTVTVRNVKDAAGNAISAGGVTSLGTVSDATAPGLASSTANDGGTVRVVFTEAVQAADATNKARFALESPTGTAKDLTPAGVTLAHDAATRTTTISGLSLTAGSTYKLTVTGVRDTAGNAMAATSLSGSVADVTAPTVTASTASTAGRLTVAFSEAVNSTDAAAKANYTLESPTGTGIDLAPAAIGLSYDAATRTATFTGLGVTAGNSYTIRVRNVRDVAGNAIVDNGTTNVSAGTVGDATAPAIASSAADDTGAARVAFTEAVNVADATTKANFGLESPTGTAIDLSPAGVTLAHNAATRTTAISGLALEAGRTYRVTVRNVRDAAGNAISAGGVTSSGTVSDATAPGLVSSTGDDSGLVRVVFTEAVQAADATNKARFALESPTGTAKDLTPAGVTLAHDAGTRTTTISGLSLPADNTYKLTVTGVRDTAGNAMAATSLSGSVADVTAPTVTASTASTAGRLTVVFSEAVNSTDAAAKANYTLQSPTGTAIDLAPAGVSLSYDTATRTAALTGLTLTSGNTYTIRVRNVRDVAGNAIVDNGTTNVAAGTVGDATAPAIASSSADDTGAVRVTFSEGVVAGDATAKANFSLESPTGTAIDLSPAGVTLAYDAATRTTTMRGLALVAGRTYQVTVRNVRDAAGNAIPAGGVTSSGTVSDATAPAVASSSASDTGSVRVVFSEGVQSGDATAKANFTVESPTGTALDLSAAGVVVAYDAATRTATVSGLTLAAGSTYKVTVRNVRDPAGNAIAAAGGTSSGTVGDASAAAVASSSMDDTGVAKVTFSEAVQSGDATAKANFTVESPTGTALDLSAAGVTLAYDPATRTTTVSGLTAAAGTTYKITVRNVRDSAGNAIPAAGVASTGTVSDATAPKLASSTADDKGRVAVRFTEGVQAADATNRANFVVECPTGTALNLSGAGVNLSYDAGTTATTIKGLALKAGDAYRVKVRSVRDTAGHAIADDNVGNVRAGSVADATPPKITKHTLPGASFTAQDVTFTFAESMDQASVEGAFSLKRDSDGTPVATTASWAANTVTFTPTTSLQPGTRYRVRLANAAKDAVGNHLDGNGDGEDQGSPADDFAAAFTTTNPPTTPELVSPSAGHTTSPTPAFKVTASDPDGDRIHFVVEVTQGGAARTVETSAVDSGATTRSLWPADQALTPGAASWRAKSVDATGAESAWGDARAFTVTGSGPYMMRGAGLSTCGLALLMEPITPADLGIEGVHIARWDPARQVYLKDAEVLQLEPGVGYWTENAVPLALRFAGPVATEPFPVNLTAGWNLISAPYADGMEWNAQTLTVVREGVEKPLVDAAAEGWLGDYAIGWDEDGQRYEVIADEALRGVTNHALRAWRAYWIRAQQDCTLVLRPGVVGAQPIRSRRERAGGWSIGIQARGKGGAGEVVLGTTGSGRALTIGVPPASPNRKGGARATLVSSGGPLSVDLRPGVGKRHEWELVLAPGASPDEEVTLTWPDLRSLPKDVVLTLVDPAAGARRLLRTTASYTFRAGEAPRRLRVVAEPRLGAAVVVTGLEVVQARSNARVVRFNLSAPAAVDVEVLAPSGRVVAALARSRASVPGMNQVAWSGAAVPGVYLLRVTATTEEGASVQAARPVAVVR